MNFDQAVMLVIESEGGYACDPRDSGGATRWGISARAYPGEDIMHLTVQRAIELYRRDYWGPAGCDAVPDALRYPLLDMAVNQGVRAAIRSLQRAAGAFEDGVLGPRTLQAMQMSPPDKLVLRFAAARLARYCQAGEDQWQRFGRGWVARVARTMG